MIIIEKIVFQRGALFLDTTSLGYGLLFLFVLLLKDFKDEFFNGKVEFYENKNIIIRYISYAITIATIISMGVLDSGEFIYFKY